METVQEMFPQEMFHKEVSVSRGHTRTHSSSMELDEMIVIEFEIVHSQSEIVHSQ